MKPEQVVEEVRLAEERIRPHIRETYVEESPRLAETGAASVRLKLENLQHTGSFKVRGAMNKLLTMSEDERDRGVVAASTGNHGAAVAFGLGRLGARGIVFVPENAAPGKVRAIERLGAEVRHVGQDCLEAEAAAREHGAAHGMTYLSPYNDPQVVGGQGTLGVELDRQLDEIDTVFVSLGGGGLIAGVAGFLNAVRPGVRIVACSPENSKVMVESVRAGRILDLPSLPTLSDGTAGGVEADSITFELCRDLIDDYVTVSEEEIRDALRLVIGAHHVMIEGSAGVAVAAYRRMPEQCAGRHVAIVLCGANIDPDTLKDVLS